MGRTLQHCVKLIEISQSKQRVCITKGRIWAFGNHIGYGFNAKGGASVRCASVVS